VVVSRSAGWDAARGRVGGGARGGCQNNGDTFSFMRGASYLSAPSTPYVPTPPASMCHMLLACDEKKRAL